MLMRIWIIFFSGLWHCDFECCEQARINTMWCPWALHLNYTLIAQLCEQVVIFLKINNHNRVIESLNIIK